MGTVGKARKNARSVKQQSTKPCHPGEHVYVAHRPHVEQAVVKASLLLSTPDDLDYGELLEILGESTEAECVYFQMVPPDDRSLSSPRSEQDGISMLLWCRDEGASPPTGRIERFEASDGDGSMAAEDRLQEKDITAVPILSAKGRFYGYLGIAHLPHSHAWRDEDTRLLNVVGDMLASFFERKLAEEALQESEERWRTLVERHPDPILIIEGDRIAYINPSGCRLFGADRADDVQGRSFSDFISADEYGAIEERLQQQIGGKTVGPVQHEVTRLDGEWRIVESFAVPVVYNGGAAVQIVLRDLTERKRSEYRYSTFAETISEGIWHVRLGVSVSTTATPEIQEEHIRAFSILEECNRVMAHMLGASDPALVQGQNLWERLPAGRFVGEFVRSAYRVRNWQFSLTDEAGQVQHYVLNAVGMVERGRLVGVWGSCIDVTENVELERRMVNALEEQQQRIGRELHDGVGQLLTGVRMLAQVLVENVEGENSQNADLVRKIMRFAEEASQQVRNIYYGLTPAQLSMEGLASALDELAINTDAIPRITCTFEHDRRTDITDLQTKLHMYRIAQEAVNNALKHARADLIQLAFRTAGDHIELAIADNGVGFEPGRGSSKSLGVRSMHYRARAVGAELTIDAKPEGGTQVRCVLPKAQNS